MKNSKIEWTDHTVNFWEGCHKVAPECDNCYAEELVNRFGRGSFGNVRRTKSPWKEAVKLNAKAAADETVARAFTCSMSDFFHPAADDWRDEAWQIIRDSRNMFWMILTKRLNKVRDRLPLGWGAGWDNVTLGTSIGTQANVAWLDLLADLPAASRFVSFEPLIERVDVDGCRALESIDYAIIGGESGGNFRPMEKSWAMDLAEQLIAAGVVVFFKQGANRLPGKPIGDDRLDSMKSLQPAFLTYSQGGFDAESVVF